jgi:outer membrane immunogenic protein
MKSWFTGVVLLGLTTASGHAADMSFRAPPRYLPPPPTMSWTGFHIGVNAGYSWGIAPFAPNQNLSMLRIGPPVEIAMAVTAAGAAGRRLSGSTGGFTAGAQVGFDWQASESLVVGLEADAEAFSKPEARGTSSAMVDVPNGGGLRIGSFTEGARSLDYLGTVRARLGFLVTPSFMIYGTAGLAYGGASGSYGVLQTLYAAPFAPFASRPWTGESSFSSLRVGWTAGAGAEWMIYPGVSLKGEFLYYSLGSKATPAFVTTDPTGIKLGAAWSDATHANIRFDGYVVRAGVNIHFGATAPPASPVGRPAESPIYARY